jgi:hypothetical protein
MTTVPVDKGKGRVDPNKPFESPLIIKETDAKKVDRELGLEGGLDPQSRLDKGDELAASKKKLDAENQGPRNILLFCDGTGNSHFDESMDRTQEPSGKQTTNVWRLYSSVAPVHNGHKQYAVYLDGIGTSTFLQDSKIDIVKKAVQIGNAYSTLCLLTSAAL